MVAVERLDVYSPLEEEMHDNRLHVNFANVDFFLRFVRNNFILSRDYIGRYTMDNYMHEWLSYTGKHTLFKECLMGHNNDVNAHVLAHEVGSLLFRARPLNTEI